MTVLAAAVADPLEVMLLRIRKDPELLLELDYCVPLGIPHSEFVGAARAFNQPRWRYDDRLKVLAYREHVARRDAGRCPECRTTRKDWDPEQGGHPYRYVPDVEGCRGCELIGSLRRELEGMPEMAKRSDLRIVLRLNEHEEPVDWMLDG